MSALIAHYCNVPFVIVDSKLEPACPQAVRLGGEPPPRTGRAGEKIDTCISLSPLDMFLSKLVGNTRCVSSLRI